ncbi:hypothetical protein FRACYDRAFT_243337 [Fragilariopsis cylindrus CCMP1102]|uniref:Uncharacterized protein n=1 Tax=Fragilariopsis cylindrus CCMP1102 TaxID=635003 RepID=A0A1E7F4P5_9STRA|nr:hypothetical protein FRACYDRAFT_243337 [Fragilariopsis cylindrus CCMP1102]|eukprot:OEU12985.1 hypothetical protein FRACYDRAFT_243337 [Fragilariopsis cylindrus CCMP1102]
MAPKRKASLQQEGNKNKRGKTAAVVPVQVVVPVPVATSASAVVSHGSIKDEIRSFLHSIFFTVFIASADVPVPASAVAAVAAPVVPVVPAVRVKIGIINRASDARKIVGTEEQLIISSPLGSEGIYNFADKMVTIIVTKTPYNFRRGPSPLSLSLCQMMISLKTLRVDAFYTSDTVKTLIRSNATNLLPNLESLTMKQPERTIVNRTRWLPDGWVTLTGSCLDDDNNVFKTNPKLNSITISPGSWAAAKELETLEVFVKNNPSIERMDVICYVDYKYRMRQRRTDNPFRTDYIHKCKQNVTSAVNTLNKNRVFTIQKLAMEGGNVPSPMLERACTHDYGYVNVFDRVPEAEDPFIEPPIAIAKADNLTPLFGLVKFMLCARPSLCPKPSLCPRRRRQAPVVIADPVVVEDPVIIEDPVVVVNVRPIANAVEINNPDLLLHQQEIINPIRNSLN